MQIYKFCKVTQIKIKLIHELPLLNIRFEFHQSRSVYSEWNHADKPIDIISTTWMNFVSAAHKEMLIKATSLWVHCMEIATHKWLHRRCLRKLHYENKQESCYGLLEDPAVIKTNTRSSKQRVRQVAAKAAWPCTARADDVNAQTIPPLETPSLLRCYYVLYPDDGGTIVFRNASTPCNIPEDSDLHRR